MVESFLADNFAGICLAPVDAVALRKPVDLAIASKTPIVIFDSGLIDLAGVVSYVATNNYRGGQRAGEYLAELLGGKGNLILLRYDLTSQSTEERESGFLDAVGKHPNLKLLVADKYAGPLESGAIQLAETLLAQHGSNVQGVFCPNQSTTSGMLTALRRAGLAGKVKFVGFDAGENIAVGLKSGEINGTILQDPVKMGYDTVRVMREKLQGRSVPERLEIAEALATTENLEDPKIHELLYPPSSD
jgi:ribose transport system substrate-binding protein